MSMHRKRYRGTLPTTIVAKRRNVKVYAVFSFAYNVKRENLIDIATLIPETTVMTDTPNAVKETPTLFVMSQTGMPRGAFAKLAGYAYCHYDDGLYPNPKSHPGIVLTVKRTKLNALFDTCSEIIVEWIGNEGFTLYDLTTTYGGDQSVLITYNSTARPYRVDYLVGCINERLEQF